MQSSRPVTVSLITTTYPRAEDDLEQPRFVADLVEHMAALDDRFEFTVLAPHAEGLRKNDCINGIKIRRFQYSLNARRQCLAYGHGIPDNLRHSLRARLQLPGFCLRLAQEVMALTSDCDLLHVNWIEPGVIAGFANFFAGKPLVLSVHSVDPARRRLNQLALRFADFTLFNSEFTRSMLISENNNHATAVIYPGYDENFRRAATSPELRKELGFSSRDVLIIGVGRMIELKGFHVLLHAAERILARHEQTSIVLIGDGPQLPALQQQAADAGIGSKVIFLGSRPRAFVAKALHAADIFVTPGIADTRGRAEGFGIATVEAMVSGLACVGSDIGGTREVIGEDGQAGLLVKSGDASELAAGISQLILHPQRRQALGQAARTRAERMFTWDRAARSTLAVYRRSLGEHEAEEI